MNLNPKRFTLLLFLVLFTSSCKEETDPVSLVVTEHEATLTTNVDSLSVGREAGSSTFTIASSTGSWTLSASDSWMTCSNTSGTTSPSTVTVSIAANATGSDRTGHITISTPYATDILLSVFQEGDYYPSFNTSPATPDPTGMSSSALSLAKKMYAGWNLGNTLEVPGGETLWGNPKASQALIDSVCKAGFNTIRLPCAWSGYIEDETTCKLKASWLTRVKEVVDYCYAHQMYVIINIHWDGGWLENNPTYAKQGEVNGKQKALWEQIATYFRDYDEHLLFAGTNEVHSSNSTPTTENHTVQQSYNQTFVTAVRSTGGRNTYRNLVVQGFNTNIAQTCTYLKLPADATTGRTFVEVHFYDPWDFCGDASSSIFLWGSPYKASGTVSTWGQEDWLNTQFLSMKTHFFNNGYPVILGEYGALRRSSLTGTALTNHLASRAYYFQYVTQAAKNNGMVPCLWDNGVTSSGGMGIFNRSNGATFDRQALQALMTGAANGVYPF
jgi:endoglucanase